MRNPLLVVKAWLAAFFEPHVLNVAQNVCHKVVEGWTEEVVTPGQLGVLHFRAQQAGYTRLLADRHEAVPGSSILQKEVAVGLAKQ
eukprot:scaffold647_cov411-Prasinococcus_capsulatus_cf.AAC.20